MNINFIRHGQPDYNNIKNTDPIYFSNLAPLTDKGIEQSNNIDLAKIKDAEIIISSPYTRALQTASIISLNLNKKIIVEPLLHEWLPDKTFNSKILDFCKYNEAFIKNEFIYNFETNEEMQYRLKKVIDKYNNLYDNIIIVGHQRLFASLINKQLKYCEVFKKTI